MYAYINVCCTANFENVDNLLNSSIYSLSEALAFANPSARLDFQNRATKAE